MEPTTADLAPIRELYGRGLYRQAWQESQRYGPPTDWKSTPARLLGGRLAIQLGGSRLGRWLHLRAYRDMPTHPEAIYYHARYRLEHFGPLNTYRFMAAHPDQEWSDAAPEVRADWYALLGFLSARLRDFDRSDRWFLKADGLTADRAWICVERAAALECAERYEDALASARRSLEITPWFRPGVQSQAHLLQVLGREREALDHLLEAASRLESGIVVAHLAGVQMDLRHFQDARKSYDRYVELSPLLDRETRKWADSRLADVSYYLGDPTALQYAEKADEDFYKAFAKNLKEHVGEPKIRRWDIGGDWSIPPRQPSDPPRNALDLLASFWSVTKTTAVPPEVGGMDGLHDHRERIWAEENGFATIEFRVTPEILFDVIDRGVPFLLTLIDGGFVHSQPVFGADRIRRTAWLRDPNDNRANESPFDVLLKKYGGSGPRGLIIIPKDRLSLLDGLTFPDRSGYESLHRIQTAVAALDRPTAVAEADRADHQPEVSERIRLLNRLAVARFDAAPTLVLPLVSKLSEMFPEDNTFASVQQGVLRELSRKEERQKVLESQTARRDSDPAFAHHLAQIFLSDPDRHRESERIMRKAVRLRPFAPAGFYILGNVLWEQRRFDEAVDMYRFAASLEDRDEQFVESYFRAARALDREPDAMRFLRTRYNRTKGKLAGPARALFYALSEQDQMEDAFEVLESVWTDADPQSPHRHEIGDVLLFAAELKTHYNDPEAGRLLFEKAAEFASTGNRLRSEARAALVRADLPTARKCWEELLQSDQLSTDHLRNLSRAIADLEGRQTAVRFVTQIADRFPHHYPTQQLLIDWLRGEQVDDGDPPPAEPIIRRLIDHCPDDAWARRELALHLANHSRGEKALEELDAARRLEPHSPSYFFTRGHALHRSDMIDEAREMYREAVRRSVDNEVAIVELMNLARGDKEKKEVLDFVADELRSQREFGDGLLTFRDQAVQAHEAVEPDDLLRVLQEVFDLHPELWQSWSTVIQQLTAVGRVEEAHQLAREAVERFPLLARLWVDLAEVAQAREDLETRIHALRQATAVSPGWSFASRELADALEADNRPEEARVVLEQAVARNPLDPVNHGYLADNLWSTSQGNDAVARLQIALHLDPGYDWAWRHLTLWSEQLDRPQLAAEVSRETAARRPGDPRSWLAVARCLTEMDQSDEVIAALDRVIGLNPRGVEAYDLKAERLAEMGRYDEAKKAANPAIFERDPPILLQGRAAWVEARRGNLDTACREMSALVAMEPGYYWGWQQLTDWFNQAGRKAEFLESAQKLVELRPDNPVALTMRGEAKLQNEDREGGKQDLREAQQLEPQYSYPGMLLFDAHFQDEEFPQARAALAVLEEHISGGGKAYVVARYVQLAARTDDRESALEAFQELVTLPCDSPWPVNSSAGQMREAGWVAEVDRILRETVETAPYFHPVVLIAWLESRNGAQTDPDVKTALVRRATEVHPHNAQVFDVLAEMLSRLGRFEEARELCRPDRWDGRPPLILRGRDAWISAQTGDRSAAVSAMREIVKTDPDYIWGWQQLASWFDESGQSPEYLEASEQLVRLNPSDPSAHAFRGEAKARLGDRRGAKTDYRKAFELDPAYAFGAISLFDLCFEDDDLSEAKRVLAVMAEHTGGPHVVWREIRLAVRNRDRQAAAEAFARLTGMEHASGFVLDKACEELKAAGMDEFVLPTLSSAMSGETVDRHVARIWVQRNVEAQQWSFLSRLRDIYDTGGEGARECLITAVDSLAAPMHRDRLAELVADFRSELEESTNNWARTVSALYYSGNSNLVMEWGKDWQLRGANEPWMVHAYVKAMRDRNLIAESQPVIHAACGFDGDDSGKIDFLVWSAFDHAMAGRLENARAILDRIENEEFDGLTDVLAAMADSVVIVQSNGRSSFASERDDVIDAVKKLDEFHRPPELTHAYRRWAAAISQAAGGLAAWWWLKKNGRTPPR